VNIILVLNVIFAENLTCYRNVKNSTLTDCADCGTNNTKILIRHKKRIHEIVMARYMFRLPAILRCLISLHEKLLRTIKPLS